MSGLCIQRKWRWKPHLSPFICVLWLVAAPSAALGYFLGDTKAVLDGCKDHWTLQDGVSLPELFQITVCVDVRVVEPGPWVAFTYSSVHAPNPNLGLQGDGGAVYGWLLQVRHRFPVRLPPGFWHRLCLRRDTRGNSFSLEVNGRMVAERTVISQAIPPLGSFWLGCPPRARPPGAGLGTVELYLFRMWDDVGPHGFCEDGSIIRWSAQFWGLTSPEARKTDPYLPCDHRRLKRVAPKDNPTKNPAFTTGPLQKNFPSQIPPAATRSGASQSNGGTSQKASTKSDIFLMSLKLGDAEVCDLVSKPFACQCDGVQNTAVCQDGARLKVQQVTCSRKGQSSNADCEVHLSQPISESELQEALEISLGLNKVEVESVLPPDGRLLNCTSSPGKSCQTW
ncbi:uncharacterized protein ACNS7B_023365 [Menidia menidia]